METKKRKVKGELECPKEQRNEATLENQNPEEGSKRQLKARQLPDGLYVVYWEGGGELPKLLEGRYTGMHKVNKAIEYYMSIQRQR